LKLGKNGEALKALEESATLTKGGDPETNERYAEALVKAGEPAKAVSEIERFIAAGLGTGPMKEWLKEAYKKSKGSEEGLAEYLAKLDQAAEDRAGGDSGTERKSHPLRCSLSLTFQAAIEFPPLAI
jgi:hypothetical protein